MWLLKCIAQKSHANRIIVILTIIISMHCLHITAVLAGQAHGALVCGDCHTMHADNNSSSDPSTRVGIAASLIIDPGNPNGICLRCHDDRSEDSSMAPTVYSVNDLDDTYYPGGDFDEVGASGENGHFKLSGNRLTADDYPAAAAGSSGAVLSSDLTCWSCHAPHNSESDSNEFRLLRKRPQNGMTGAPYVFKDILVTAKAGNYKDESGTNHTVYSSGISEWCASCHSNPDNTGSGFHGSSREDADVGHNGAWTRHPSDNQFPDSYIAEYISANDGVTADWEVPFEDADGDWSPQMPNHNPTTNDRVMCLSCHRAHVGRSSSGPRAAPNSNALRWNPGAPSGHDSGCNKCHNK